MTADHPTGEERHAAIKRVRDYLSSALSPREAASGQNFDVGDDDVPLLSDDLRTLVAAALAADPAPAQQECRWATGVHVERRFCPAPAQPPRGLVTPEQWGAAVGAGADRAVLLALAKVGHHPRCENTGPDLMGCNCGAARAARPDEADKCADCGHRSAHDEQQGRMAEVGEGGSGSVADAVFCKCKTFSAQPDAALTDGERAMLHDAMAAWAKVMPYNHLGMEYGLSDGIWTRLDAAVERILAARATRADSALSDGERIRDAVERCLRLRNEDGTHKVPAEARNIIRAAMDAARAAQPSHIDIEVQLTNDERLKISAVVHQNYYMPDVFAVVQQIKADALAARAAQPVPAPEVSRGVAEVNIIQRIVNAWDCCATCAGGVLARHDREVKAEALREAAEALEHVSIPQAAVLGVGYAQAELIDRADRLVRDALGGERGEG